MSDFLDKYFLKGDFFGPAERAAIDVVRSRSGNSDDVVLLAVGLVVWAHRNGDPCVDLRQIGSLCPGSMGENLPDLEEFIRRLQAAPEVVRMLSRDQIGDVSTALSDTRPLVVVDHFLFSQRQFTDELTIAYELLHRASLPLDGSIDTSIVDKLIPIPSDDDIQAKSSGDDGIANRVGKSILQRKLTVLTGGPGTGKTHTLTRCLAALLTARLSENVNVALIAPTGKAATRAKELISQFVKEQTDAAETGISLSTEVLDALSRIEPKTIQRVLGYKSGQQTRFLHNSTYPLKEEIVIVDEMSMVPSFLMARLLEAIKRDSTVLLVGDQAQLESVESGSVLREIVQSSLVSHSVLADSVFELRRVWRQAGDTKIGDLARFIRAGESEAALELAASNPRGVKFREVKKEQEHSADLVDDIVSELIKARDLALSTAPQDHARALEIISQNKVLCGPREGIVGINFWNHAIQSKVQSIDDDELFRPGTPLLVTVNSPRVQKVNGDIGVVVNWMTPDNNIETRIYFPGQDGGQYLSIAELPPVEKCFAMTIHKSQGSEYSNLVVFLPGLNSPLLTRELIYTAITRAKKSVTIVGERGAFIQAINNVSTRSAGISWLMGQLTPGN